MYHIFPFMFPTKKNSTMRLLRRCKLKNTTMCKAQKIKWIFPPKQRPYCRYRISSTMITGIGVIQKLCEKVRLNHNSSPRGLKKEVGQSFFQPNFWILGFKMLVVSGMFSLPVIGTLIHWRWDTASTRQMFDDCFMAKAKTNNLFQRSFCIRFKASTCQCRQKPSKKRMIQMLFKKTPWDLVICA